MPDPAIPLARPDVGSAEEAEVLEVLRSGRLALGPKTLEFERLVASFTGSPWAAAASSGTAGLHLAVRALGVGPDDCVVTSSFSFIASANCVTYEGALPVFVDVDPDTLCLSIDPLRSYLASCKASDDGLRDPVTHRRVAAILPVDAFGHPVDFDRVRELAAPWDIPIVADSCEALGSRRLREDGARVHAGAGADAAVFAFYPNKQVTTGEGGMVVGADPDLDERIRSLRNQGRRPGDPWLHHTRIGFNHRLSELQAALGVAQMRRIDEILARRAAVAALYVDALADVDEVETPRAAPWAEPAWFVMHLRVAPGVDRDRLVHHLNASGIEAKAYFDPPIHLQPPYAGRADLVPAPLAATEEASRRILIVPFFSTMSEEQVGRVVEALRDGLARGRPS
jgi:perosamine synthetase